jgi:acyl-CoA thioesterase-1
MSRLMWLLVSIFVLLLSITVWSLLDKEPPSLVRPITQPTSPTKVEKTRQLIAFWDSLTAGYQLTPEESFPAKLQKLFDQNNIAIKVINAWKSGDTSAQMRERLEWSLEDTLSGDILLLTAWANDGLQWLPLSQLEENIRAIIAYAQDRSLVIILWGMKLPPNYWAEYASEFEALYKRLATDEDIYLIPFLLEDVAAIPQLNLDDGIHPNAAWYAIIANTIFTFIREKVLD